MDQNTLVKVKQIVDKIEHCGDYGETYINTETHEVLIVLGDADEVDYNKLKMQFDNLNVKFDTSNEWYPEDDTHILISHGKEKICDWWISDEDEECDLPSIRYRILSLEDYAKFYLFWKGLPEC